MLNSPCEHGQSAPGGRDQTVLLAMLWKIKKTYIGPDETADEITEPYIVTDVNKDGFGSVTYDDLRFYVKAIQHRYPRTSRMLIQFSDGIGIEIRDNDLSRMTYGTINKTGKVEDGININISDSLQNQIEGITTIIYDYDEQRNPIHEIHMGADGNLVANTNSVAEVFREYDKDRHIIWEKWLGEDGLPALNSSGTAESRREYDGENLIRQSFYDGKGNLVCLKDLFYSSARYEYDKCGNCISEEYFDDKGYRVLCSAGYAGRKSEYLDKHMISETFYDKDANPLTLFNGYAARSLVYDKSGNVCSEKYYGEDGNPVICTKGYAVVESVYDDNKQIIEQRYYDTNGLLTISSYGYAILRRSYDDEDVIEEYYFYTNDKPLKMDAGYYGIRQKWDEDTLVERSYLDAENNLIERTDGYSTVLWELLDGTRNARFLDYESNEIQLDGINLVQDFSYGSDGWSEWMSPVTNIANSCFYIGCTNLGKSQKEIFIPVS